jgi:hypothetical protein
MIEVINRYNIQTRAFKDILEQERKCLEWLNTRTCVGIKRDIAYEVLRKIRLRKEFYEAAVEKAMG